MSKSNAESIANSASSRGFKAIGPGHTHPVYWK